MSTLLLQEEREIEVTKIESLEDVKQWIAVQDALTNERWENQWKWNKATDDKFSKLFTKLSALEKRVIWLTALAAAGGGVAGNLLQGMIGG